MLSLEYQNKLKIIMVYKDEMCPIILHQKDDIQNYMDYIFLCTE